ncbi:D-3-phosphoglycerate dehydrogenase [Clostridium algifaecis]|uniref:D-3-phosphoglycerate dehydrogenase n=1 Tax=Clostridium algifaecis TaxID=1472040 RepID=A0ABS4KPQ0_9CLOT|nr:NAD(P)-dependent oxidoreductase [Clostridium algifaecis]MBP2032018.1 D-3-phosphoglycerate dehydrogenase [Clostridium algifaecis]
MKVYLSENIAKSAYNRLAERAEIVTNFKHPEKLDAIMVRRVHVTREIIEKAVNLKVISMHGIGRDTIDVEAAREHGIPVPNVPNQSMESVAELAVAQIMILSRNIKKANIGICQNRYNSHGPIELIGNDIYGKTLGMVGIGKISLRIAEMMGAAFHVNLTGYDPFVSKDEASSLGIKKINTIQKLFSNSDYVNISVPLTDSTKNLIGKNALDAANPNLILVNTSRGGIVDEKALYDALINGKIKAAASDVFLSEPPKKDNPLVLLENFVATPHIGGNTKECLERVGNTAVDNLFTVIDAEK